MEALFMDCGVAGLRCCSAMRELRWAGTERFGLGVREPLVVEPGKSWLPPALGMEGREVGALETGSAVWTTKRSDGNRFARPMAIEVDCAPTWQAEELNVSPRKF